MSALSAALKMDQKRKEKMRRRRKRRKKRWRTVTVGKTPAVGGEATGLTREAKLQPLAEMTEKLQPAATLSAPRAEMPEEASESR